MNICLKAFFIVILTTVHVFAAGDDTTGVKSDCSDILLQANQVGHLVPYEEESELTKQVRLIWYPKSEYIFISHAELEVNGHTWDATAGYKRKSTIEISRRAAKSGGYGFFEFGLLLTTKELSELETYLAERTDKRSSQMCISGVCSAIKSTTGIRIPFPFSKVPTLAAIYLSVAKLLGYKRIHSIQYVGKSAIRNIVSPAVAEELFVTSITTFSTTYVTGYILVQSYNYLNQLVTYMIPLLAS